jgi:3-oxoadipate enol-lactonase
MPRIQLSDIALEVIDRGRGPVVLLVHGFPLDHTMWSGQIDALSRSHRVLAPDLRGFGKSDVTPSKVTMQQFADDLAAMLTVVGVAEPVTFCGLSMGGYIGWQFFARHRAKLARLVQCDTRAVADSPEARDGRLKGADDTEAHGPATLVDAMLPKLFPQSAIEQQREFVVATKRVMLGTSPHGIAAAARGMAERPDVTAMLPQIDVPTLIVCGEHDAIAATKEMRGIANAIPRAQYVEIAGAGHMAPLEDPAKFNAALLQFLTT